MLKDIVVHLALDTKSGHAAAYAISVARVFEAHLTGIALVPDPFVPLIGPMETLPPDFIETQRRENERAAKAAVDRFTKAANAAGITAAGRTMEAKLKGTEEAFAHFARGFDLSVIGQSPPDEPPADALIEAALFDSGRPLIAVPFIQKTGLSLERVIACWDGSRAAARAIADGLPLLTRADAVELLTVQRSERSPIEGIEMAEHLQRHRVPVRAKTIVAGDLDAGNAILSRAADWVADFMVMGGYGHSRMREFVLGGVTRTTLESMTVPILMSH
jgi:nucleotide-binding universal stress UspA family protein